jgi:hypothetical protein
MMKPMNPKITDTDYAFVEKPSSELYSVKLKSGPWSGVIVTYGKVSLKVNEDKESATLSFQFKVDEAPDVHDIDELEMSADFNNHLGDILSHIIQNAFDTGNYKVGSNDKQSTNNDSSEISE